MEFRSQKLPTPAKLWGRIKTANTAAGAAMPFQAAIHQIGVESRPWDPRACYDIYLWFYLHSLSTLFCYTFSYSLQILFYSAFYYSAFYYSASYYSAFLLFSLLLFSFSIIQLYYSATFLLRYGKSLSNLRHVPLLFRDISSKTGTKWFARGIMKVRATLSKFWPRHFVNSYT